MEVLPGSRAARIERLQKEWDRYIVYLKQEVAGGKLTEQQADKLADTYHQGLWEGVKAIYDAHTDRPRFERRGDHDFEREFSYLPE